MQPGDVGSDACVAQVRAGARRTNRGDQPCARIPRYTSARRQYRSAGMPAPMWVA